MLSIRSTVLTAIAAAVLAPTAILWHLEQQLTRDIHVPLIEQNRKAVLLMTASALVQPMWSLDEPAIHSVAQRVLDEPAVQSLRLTERRPLTPPTVLARANEVPFQGVSLKTTILHEGETLGELELWFDPGQITRLLAERRQATIQLAALQVLLSMVVLIAVLYRRLLAPIQKLKRQASAIASRADLEPVRWDSRDELGQLGSHLNDVHQQIDTLFDQLEAQKTELEKIALHDSLTGLPNRALFGDLTQAAVAGAARDGSRLALLFIDVDRFKTVNDTLGHAAGDALLQQVAGRLRDAVRAGDTLARLGGDEFAVLQVGTAQPDGAAVLGRRLIDALSQPFTLDGHRVHIGVSIGVATAPLHGDRPDTLLKHADMALYRAKAAGRGVLRLFEPEMALCQAASGQGVLDFGPG